MSRFRVGLTGGLASGKSTVARLLAREGFEVVDADQIVARLYEPGGAGAAAVGALFGPAVLTANGGVEKRALAGIVFGDVDARRKLEAAIHPLVRSTFREIAGAAGDREGAAPVVLEATRLVEAGYAPDFDLVVSVEAPEELRLERAIERGLSREEAQARLAAQGDGAVRRGAAHRLLTNGGTLSDLEEKVAELAREIRQLASAR